MEFKNQIGIITGAASGIGLAIASRLASGGLKLALFDRDSRGLEKARQRIVGEVATYAVDISNAQEVSSAIDQVKARFGKIDVLINSAGITGKTNIKSHEVTMDELSSVFNVNFTGAFLTSKYVLPVMLENGYGRILHIASIAGKEGNAGMLAYSASKAAVIGMTKVQGKEYADTGVTVNAIAPAVIRTALVDAMPEEQVTYMTDKIPMKRCGTLDEVAEAAAFIVSPKCSFTTGFTFDLSGGRATY